MPEATRDPDPSGMAVRVVDAIEKLADACVLYPAPGSMAARQKAKLELFDALTAEPGA